jgi:FkbM family methyltransferase
MHESKIIYDFGSNNGDDIPYYLQKADKVVAVEANPGLVAQIVSRFSQDIAAQRLVVEHCVLTVDNASSGAVSFYVHKLHHVLSQFPRPDSSTLHEFDEILLPSRSVVSLIEQHGAPFYIKVDLEGYDQVVLTELFRRDIRPKFISAESHSIEVFAVLVALGRYTSFNLVDGPTVHSTYANHPIMARNGTKEPYTFPHHSAGPFGEDIKGAWMTPDNFFRRLAFERLGWKDIHATNEIAADPATVAYSTPILLREVRLQEKERLRRRAPTVFKALKKVRRTLGA